MTEEEFANACAALDRIAIFTHDKLPHPPLCTTRKDVEAVVRMARWAWHNHRDDQILQAIIDLEAR